MLVEEAEDRGERRRDRQQQPDLDRKAQAVAGLIGCVEERRESLVDALGDDVDVVHRVKVTEQPEAELAVV